MKFVIEHLEALLSPWLKIEYKEISTIVGKRNLIFTNIKRKNKFFFKLGTTQPWSITTKPYPKMIILDPTASQELRPQDCNTHNYLVFGGILGDYPPRQRTKESITSKLHTSTRNLGTIQMSTDTAVRVAKMICNGKKLGEIPFMDHVSIELGQYEAVDLPYRYVQDTQGKPILAKGLIAYLKAKRRF
ncbi:MAG: SAM-dependent methyltransferase [Nanoarchaeota archaeon]